KAQLALVTAGPRQEDIRATRANLRSARSKAEYAQKELKRYRALSTQGAATESRLDRLESDLERAKGSVAALEAKLRAQVKGARSAELEMAAAAVEAAAQRLDAAEDRVADCTLEAPLAGT